MSSDSIDNLAELFLQFPGIGRKQARRFVYALLHKNQHYTNELIEAIQKLKQQTSQCKKCFRFYPKNNNDVCELCLQADSSTLLIVEKDADLENLQRTKIYNGSYFVLGGFISSHEKRRSYARVDQLIERITLDNQSGILKELIFGLSVSPEAEHTRFRLVAMIKDRFPKITFSTLGRGLSTGTELEYSDEETLKHALQSRMQSNS